MKHGRIPAYIFAVSIAVLIFYAAYVWMGARDQSERLRKGLDLAYSLQHDDAELQLQLSVSISDIYTDILNSRVDDWLEDTVRFKSYIRMNNKENTYLADMADAIEEAHAMRAETIEDFKSYRAIVNNSFLWLRTQESDERLTPEEGWVFHRMMDGFYTNDLEDSMPAFIPFGGPLIQQHMKILYTNVIEMNRVNIKLAHTRTDGLLEKLILYLEGDLQKTEKLRTSMMWSFVTGILSSLAAILFLYWRERASSEHVRHLANDLRQFVDALNQSEIVSKTDPQGYITFVNDEFCHISGYSREELIGKPHSIVRHPATPASVFRQMWSTIQRGENYKTMLQNLRKNGESYYVNTVVIPMKNSYGEIVEYLAVRHDVTELVAARDQAIAAERFKDSFLSNMSHELRTPLNGIIGFSNLLESKISDPIQRKYLGTILESSQHLLAIINDVLDLSKIKSDRFALDSRPFELNSSFESLIQRFSAQAQTKNIVFTSELDFPENQIVEGDWLRISQVITNLLSNAFKFTDEGGKVAFKARYDDGILECKIADSGIGMDPATIARIFHAFEQADSSITRKYGGTGLGLSITKELVQRMEGTIEVTSHVGVGSKFSVRIRLQPSDIHPESARSDENQEVRFQGHVLVAEDNEVNMMLITLLLEDFGVDFTAAKDGAEAVEMFQSGSFDLVLMDENMPNLSGIEAMQKIRQLPGGTLPIIALTANVMAGDKERFLEAGMDDFIPKPVDIMKLRSVLTRYLSHNRMIPPSRQGGESENQS